MLAVAEQIPRDERTRQAMREKACVEVPLEEQLQVISASDWLITNVQHKPITQREAKAALARLAARGTRAPGPSGSRTILCGREQEERRRSGIGRTSSWRDSHPAWRRGG